MWLGFLFLCCLVDEPVAHKVTSYGKPALGGPWELVNQDGVPVTDASYQGEYLLLYFGFTYCPDICPSELVKMGKVVTMLGAWWWRRRSLWRFASVPVAGQPAAMGWRSGSRCSSSLPPITRWREKPSARASHFHQLGS